jgi:hypothetical protein
MERHSGDKGTEARITNVREVAAPETDGNSSEIPAVSQPGISVITMNKDQTLSISHDDNNQICIDTYIGSS